MKSIVVRFDAPFWVLLLSAVILAGSLGCIGRAAVAQDAARGEASLVRADGSSQR